MGFLVSAGVAGGAVLGAPALADLLSGGEGPRASAQSQSGLDRQFARLPLRFEANQGQAPGAVDFLARGPGYTMAISPTGAVLALSGGKASTVRGAGRSAVVGMHLVGGNPSPTATTGTRLPGVSNYIVGADRKDWRTAVPSYARIRYHEVYRGIDLVYRGNQKELEYDLIVAAGADPAKIAVGFRGARRLSITSTGDLLIHSRDGVIRQRRPVVYQGTGATRRHVDARYVLEDGARRIGFRLGAYDRTKTLVIDPSIAYSTHLGGYNTTVANGSSQDTTNGIAVDAQGNSYVVGFTDSIPPTPYPTTAGALQTAFGGGARDGFVTKLNPAGNAILYSTYIGGSLEDRATDVAVGTNGNAYVSGFTVSTNFPTTAGAYQPANAGGARDGFIAQLNATGTALTYSTYLGGTGSDTPNRIALDGANNAYVGGTTGPATGSSTNNYPTTAGAFQTTFGGGAGATAPNDAFVTKLNATGTALAYSTFLGGALGDTGASIDVDAAGSAYVAGTTTSPTIFGTPGAFDTTLAPPAAPDTTQRSDAYVAKLNPAGSALDYATYVGGARADTATGIAVNASGQAHITGEVASTDFPTDNANQPANASIVGPFDSDSYLTKLNAAGSDTVYSTYNGGHGYDTGTDVAVDPAGNAYAVGNTLGTFPLKNPVQVRTGDYDSYLTKFDPAGAVVYSTIYGGGSRDFGQAVAADAEGSAYIGGRTDYYSEDSFPVKNAPQPRNGGFGDAWIAKIRQTPNAPLVNTLRSRGGPETGNTTVVITGVGFNSASAVRFGTTSAKSFVVDSDTQITAVSPPHAAGKVNVTVTTPAGTSPDNPVTLFEYAEGAWKLTGAPALVHYDHQMKLLDDGRVLLIGGNNAMFGSTIAATEIYDPKTRTWSATGNLSTPRASYTVTRLDGPACRAASRPAYCGDVLVAGGSPNSASTNTSLNTAETFDASTGTWTPTGNLTGARSQHAAALLDGPECHAAGPPSYCGKVLVVGGIIGGASANVALSTAELYDPATRTWSTTGSMTHTARQTAAVLLPNGHVLLPGGEGSNRQMTEIYNPGTGTWDVTGPLNIGRERHSLIALANGKVLIASGTRPGDPPYLGTPQWAGDSAELYDPNTGIWTLLPDRLEGAARNNHDTALLPSGKVLLAGGGRGGLTSELFDPSTNTWSSAGLLNISRGSGHPQASSWETVVLSSDPATFEADSAVCGNDCGKALVAGNSDERSAELYTPEPRIDGLDTTSGPQTGGTTVKIRGQGFTHGVSAVLFGDTPAASFTVDSYGQITAVSPAGSGTQKVSVINEGGRATSGDEFTYVSADAPAGPPTQPAPPGPPAPPAPGATKATAKLSLARATINRRDRILDVLAPITSLASGRADVELHAAGQRYRFTAPVNSRDGRIRFQQRIPAAQARVGTGILTITYKGDADTRPQKVRLRAARQKAELRLQRPAIAPNWRLRASGTVSDRARGVGRVQLEYVVGGETKTHQFLAKISDGRWSLNQALSQSVRNEIANRTGTVHSYTLFTGYMPARMRGEMRSFQVLAER